MALLDWLLCPFCGDDAVAIRLDSERIGGPTGIEVCSNCDHGAIPVGFDVFETYFPATECPTCGECVESFSRETRRDGRTREDVLTVSCPNGHSVDHVLLSEKINPLEKDWGPTESQSSLGGEWSS